MLSFIIIIYFSINSVLSLANNYQLNINIDYEENNTIILFYNLSTNYSYFLTFRSFGNEQFKFGLFFPTNKFEQHSIEILYQYSTTELFYLFIICFHFILQINDIDIQCEDIRLYKNDYIKSDISQDFLPSYNPLFVPMMYALSIVMLLPVIIQHHRHKKAQLLKRQKELKRLSITISHDQQNPAHNIAQDILSQIIENGNINYKNIPTDIELVSIPSPKPMPNDINKNVNLTFGIQNLQSFIHKYDDNDINEQSSIDAHECIAHLLDNTPWNKLHNDQIFSTSSFRNHSVIRDSTTPIKDQYLPTIIPFHDDDDDDDRKPILKTIKYPISNFHRTNRVFLESDV